MIGADSIYDERARSGERPGLSAQARGDHQPSGRGKLTIFFGAAPGVGKTSAMLEAARAGRDRGLAVLVGAVESHDDDTNALVAGLAVLPRRTTQHGSTISAELDLDAALERRPDVLVVDDLAHANAEGSRHAGRWQDVEDLLDAGISVHATLGVHQIESLNDVVAETTGVRVRETVPDRIFDRADDVRLVDLLPDELLQRLGKGEAGDGEGLFTKKNLVALRALALRQTAACADQQTRSYQHAPGGERVWPVAGRMLVCVSPSPSSARLIRATRRMATELHAEWIAAYVETPASLRRSASEREQIAQNLRLAEQLGAEVVTRNGPSAAEESIRYARSRNVTRIVVGKPRRAPLRDLFWPRFLDEIVRGCEDIDVYVISGDWMPSALENAVAPRLRPFEIMATLAVVAASTLIAWTLFGREMLPDVAMVFLLGVVVVAMRFSLYAATLATVASVLSYDVLFIPPYFSVTAYDGRHLVTFAVMFLVAVVISTLMQRIREQANAARIREQRTARLYAMTRELSAARSIDRLSEVATRHLQEFFESEVVLLVPTAGGQLEVRAASDAQQRLRGDDARAARWVWEHDQSAGAGTDTLPSARALFVPLLGSHGRVGVLGVVPRPRARFVDAEQRQILETFAAQTAGALERARIAGEAEAARLEVETEQLRSSLLSSVSHDLRTPLAVITGAASTLLSESEAMDPPAQRDLLSAIYDESVRLTRLVVNLLDMTRLSAGALKVNKEWQSIEAVVGAAIGRVEDRLGGRPLQVHVPANLPLVAFDAVLVEQVLINLLENAGKYSPPSTPVRVSASANGSHEIVLEVADRGPGVPEAARTRIFEKFYRLPGARAGGAGLGLAICRGIVEAHGGRIGVVDREGGGARFRFNLPIEGSPPAVEEDGGAT